MMRVEPERFLVRAFFKDRSSASTLTDPGQSLEEAIRDEEEFLAGKVSYFTIEKYAIDGTQAEVVYDNRRGPCTQPSG